MKKIFFTYFILTFFSCYVVAQDEIWYFDNAFPDSKIKFVTSFEDLKIQYVNSRSSAGWKNKTHKLQGRIG